MKHNQDFDDVFQTLKTKHIRLFIPVINEIFGKNYPADSKVTVLPSDGFLTQEGSDGETQLEKKISDFLIQIGNEIYLLECQSYDDGSMAIRIAEYAFLAARQHATWDAGTAVFTMPHFSVIYIRKTDNTPRKTKIIFRFPGGESVDYEADNVLLDELTKEYIVEKRLFPYIPFYIVRYTKALTTERAKDDDIRKAIEDLEYFKKELLRLRAEDEITDDELIDLTQFVNKIITHITDGNKNEGKLVNVMGGTVLETESERLRREGENRGGAKMLIEMGREFGLDDTMIVEQMQKKINISLETALSYLELYGKQ
jgi:hypothetical protein